MSEVSLIEVTGNDGSSQKKAAERAVLKDHPNAEITAVSFWGRGTAGAPVYAVQWKESDG